MGRQHVVDRCISLVRYGLRDETRREHRQVLLNYLQIKAFRFSNFCTLVHELTTEVLQTDKALLLATRALTHLRNAHVVVPPLRVIDRVCSQAILRANRRLYRRLVHPLTECHS